MCVCVGLCGCSKVRIMAVSSMSAWCRASVLCLYLLVAFLQVSRQTQVFQARQAHNTFLRSKRANRFLIEEILQGNLERECYEEKCNYEEALEYFEDTTKTITFWTVYIDGDQCKPNPCLHGGNCTDMVGGFHCSCVAPHYGLICELSKTKELTSGGDPPVSVPHSITQGIMQCPIGGPGACQQLCTASYNSFTCSCLSGFKLHSDKQTCLPDVEFPCGRLPDRLKNSTSMCHQGNCPWQVSLLNSRGVELCGGVVLGRRSVLTAAHCLFLDSKSEVEPSNFYVVAGNHETFIRVQALYVHDRFRSHHHDDDLALLELAGPLVFGPTIIQLCIPTKDYSENVLMHSGRTGVLAETGVEQSQDLVYMTLEDCRSQLTLSHPLSNKMFCMRKQNVAQIGKKNEDKDRSARLSGHSHEKNYRRAQRPLGNQTGVPRSQRKPLENQNRAQEVQGRHTEKGSQNQTQNTLSGVQGTSNRTENHNSSIADSQLHKDSSRSRTYINGSRCRGLLPGAPVATVEQGTAFLTGLMISSSSGCNDGGGLVFTKLSRYLSWIKPRLEAVEDHMTPQVKEYPKKR